MNLLDRIFAEPELQARPPVLVDVGAAGGVNPAWRRIARHAIGVGFEPDARETAALSGAQRQFSRWIFCPALATAVTPTSGRQSFNLTVAPQCSSLLAPDRAGLAEWVFADQFEIVRQMELPASGLTEALQKAGLAGIDWLKCDTQGTDLKLYQSLPADWRERLLAVEFEPGFIDAYTGEDQVADILAAMKPAPFWLSRLDVGKTPRGRPSMMPMGRSPWSRRLAPSAPAWAGLQFLRDVARTPRPLDRRAWLLTWVFATIAGQPGQALTVALEGQQLLGGLLFEQMAAYSRRQIQWAMVRNFPGWVWRRFSR